MKLIRILLLGAASCVLSLSVSAQWQWIDKSGHKVFSDRPPPPEIPEKSIVRPAGRSSPAQVATPSPAPAGTDSPDAAMASPSNAVNTPKLSGLDKALADKKQQAAEAEAARRKAQEEKTAQARFENCERAQRAKSSLDAGLRQLRINEQGEREVLDEVARAAESQRVQSIIESDCK
jgi:hypothetical protein